MEINQCHRLVHPVNNQGTNPATAWKPNRSKTPESGANTGINQKAFMEMVGKEKDSEIEL